jgi:hypothetical protein
MRYVSSKLIQLVSMRALSAVAIAAILPACAVKFNKPKGTVTIKASETDPLVLTSFTGAGNYKGGSVQNITWDSVVPTGVTLGATPISLEYSVDDGSTWTSIATNEANDGAYAWTLPSIDSATVRVRLIAADASGNSLSDSSDASFRIDSTVPTVVLSSLDGGGAYRGSSSQNVTWTAADSGSGLDAASILVEYSTDSGATFSAVAAGEANDGTYAWSLPAALSSQTVRVRVTATDAAGNSASDFSAADFTVDSAAPVIALTSPNGAENYAGGSSQTITWTAATDNLALAASPISLDYSTDGGTNWTSIATGEANDGTYTWNPLPSVNSNTVRVRVTAADAVGNTASDASNANFTIDSSGPVLAITAPTGAVVLRGGASQAITWTATDVSNLPATPITLEYTVDNGSNWTSIANNEANDGTYSWTVPSINSQTVKLRVTAVDTIGNSTAAISATNFTIDSTNPVIAITAPNGGEAYASGSTQSITWTAATDNFGLATTPITLHYSTNSGTSWTQIATGEANDGTYSWSVPSISSTTVRVRVTALDAAGNSATSASAADFTVDNTGPSVTLSSLDGGGVYAGGSSQAITWTASAPGGLVASPISLHYSTDGGSTWTAIATGEANDGTYTWNPLPSINSQTVRVRVTALANSSLTASDASASNFTIDSTNPVIALTAPTGGQTYAGGSSQNITWTAATDNFGLATSPVSLEYSTNSGTSWTSIATNEANDGTYSWTVPSIDSSTVRVRVIATDAAGNTSNSASGSNLTIDSTNPTITLTSLDGGSSYRGGTAQNVSWTVSDTGGLAATPISIDYSTDSGSTWTSVATNQSATSPYAWTLPSINSATVRVRVTATDATGHAASDASSADFTIDSTGPVIALTSFTGGGSYMGASSQSITWTAATDALAGMAATPITLEYSTNSGTSWTSIAASEANDGSYTWNPLPSINSSTVRVRITAVDAVGNTSTDSSGSDLVIDSTVPAITLTSFTGGSAYQGGVAQNITWTAATDNIALATSPITLEYSTDSGSSWTSIAGSEANDGSYAWTVASINSTTVRVRLTAQDRAGNVAYSSSTSDFEIDSAAPTAASLAINGGNASTTSQNVTLTLAATGASTMCIQEAANCTGCSSYVAFATTVNSYALSAGAGAKTVAASIRDAVGNAVCVTDSINFTTDADAPTSPSIAINGGATDTNFRKVALTLAATEAVSLPMEMCISESGTCAGCSYETYATSKVFELTAGAAAKTVGVKYKDAAGNETACVNASINSQASVTVAARFSNATNWNDYARRCSDSTNGCAGLLPSGSTAPTGAGMPAENAAACTGAETGGAPACVHGGERRKVATEETSCSGLTATDSLGAFDWTCAVVSGKATFYSNLKTSKRLADLVTHGDPVGSWTNNSVTVTKTYSDASTDTAATTAAAWWTNLVRALPDNSATCSADGDGSGPAWTCPGTQNVATLDRASTVYTLNATRATRGYNINADKIAIATLGTSATVTAATSGSQCNTSTFEVGTNATCLIASGTQKFLWVEGRYAGTASSRPAHIFGLKSVTYSHFRDVSAAVSTSTNYYLYDGVNNNRFTRIRSQGTDGYSFRVFPAGGGTVNGNIFAGLNVAGSGNDGISVFKDFDYNVFSDVIVSSATSSGIQIRGDAYNGDGNSKFNTFSRMTLNNNRYSGLKFWTDGAPLTDMIIHNAAIAGNGANEYALSFAAGGGVGVTRPTLSQFAVSRNLNATGGIFFETVSSAKITGNLLVGNNTTAQCSVSGGTNPGLTTTTCAAANASDHNLVSNVDAIGSFVVKATSDSANGIEDGSGQATGANITATPSHWFNFDSFYRYWGLTDSNTWPNAGLNQACAYNSGSCQIFDWTLKTAASVIRNTTGDGANQNGSVSGGACPAEAAGSYDLSSVGYTYNASYFAGLNGVETSGGDSDGVCETGETCVQRYHANATEILGDDSGDEDGLCESNEACLYTPNFGAYQGHGTLTSCTFTNGGASEITGVSMYYYPSNGY